MAKSFLSWRTDPRSFENLQIMLRFFYKHRNESLSKSVTNHHLDSSPKNSRLYPVRREIEYEDQKYLFDTKDMHHYTAFNRFLKLPEKDFIAGLQNHDFGDKEGAVRQAMTTAEQYGLMNARTGKLTPMGFRAGQSIITADDIIQQLVKIYIIVNKGIGVFPFQTFLIAINKFGYLSRNELSFIFGVLHTKDTYKALIAISDFRLAYNRLPAGYKAKNAKGLVYKVWNKYFPKISKTNLQSIRSDYTDAFLRILLHTGMFYVHGYGLFKHIDINPLNSYKFKMLLDHYQFTKPDLHVASRDDLSWFGSTDNITLPWNNSSLAVQTDLLKCSSIIKAYPNCTSKINKLKHILLDNPHDLSVRKNVNNDLNKYIYTLHKSYLESALEHNFNRQKIMGRFSLIHDHMIPHPSDWLEDNTFQALLALNHTTSKQIHWFGKMNPDLTPQQHAPGHYPDLVASTYKDQLVIEVSLMTNSSQTEHECPSIKNHVKTYQHALHNKHVCGLFIADDIADGTWDEFWFYTCHQNVPVVPMSIARFKNLLTFMYKNHYSINYLTLLINKLISCSKGTTSYHAWQKNMDVAVSKWSHPVYQLSLL